jgi:hypothetical protein
MLTSSETTFHLAQINVTRAIAPLDDPLLSDFVAQLDIVNAVADADPGFVWRLKSDDGGASSYVKVPGDERLLINLTVWKSIESLKAYVYRSHEHAGVFRDRRKWFEPPDGPTFTLWWIRAGDEVTVDEGFRRLEILRTHGPTPEAFTFKASFPPPVGSVAESRVER